MNALRRLLTVLLFILFVVVLAAPPEVFAQAPTKGTGLPLPRFVSLRAQEVNMRAGPGVRYPVEWVYKRQFLPVEVIAEFGTWRKVRDGQGVQGWIHQTMLSSRRTILVTGKVRSLRKEPNSESKPVARLEVNLVGRLVECREGTGWCRLEFKGVSGWLRRVEFWGAYPGETVK